MRCGFYVNSASQEKENPMKQGKERCGAGKSESASRPLINFGDNDNYNLSI
jgi:hypothetical protein